LFEILPQPAKMVAKGSTFSRPLSMVDRAIQNVKPKPPIFLPFGYLELFGMMNQTTRIDTAVTALHYSSH
jgi:hypothetical protein